MYPLRKAALLRQRYDDLIGKGDYAAVGVNAINEAGWLLGRSGERGLEDGGHFCGDER